MKVGIIGSGGREHAICYSLSKSNKINRIFCFPGNAGTSSLAENVDIDLENFESLKNIFKYFSNLENLDYLKDLIELNKRYRDKLSWDLRTKKIFKQLK